MSDLPCVICHKEHDHRSGDHVCVGNLQDEIERLRARLPENYDTQLEFAQKENKRLQADLDYWKKLSHDEYWKQVKSKDEEIARLQAENERLNAVIKECGRDDALAYLRLEEIGTLQAKVERLEAVVDLADGYLCDEVEEYELREALAALQESE